MEIQDSFDRKKVARKVRVKVKTNRNLDFITAIKHDATISDLANRALGVYLQLAEDAALPAIKKQLTVSAVKQGIFYMPKSQFVANLLNPDDEVEVIIIKAKPKYPNQIFQNQEFFSKHQIAKSTHLQPQQPVPKQLQQQELQNQNEFHDAKIALQIQAPRQPTPDKVSKRQKKKEKKKEKFERQKKAEESNNLQKSQKKFNNLVEIKEIQEGDFIVESVPRKKLKFQKDQPAVPAEKVPQIIVPSPKITFHMEPISQLPKVSLLNDSSKKKPIEGQARKPSEDLEKKSQIEKILSPAFASRSPLIYQRTPSQPQHQQTLKPKEKEELSNFALSGRKMSEDRRIDAKKEKPKEEHNVSKDQQLKVSQIKADEKDSVSKVEVIIEKKEDACKGDAIKGVKAAQSLVVVEQDDSDSEQNKKTNEIPNAHHRQKELNEIEQKIQIFQFSSEEEN